MEDDILHFPEGVLVDDVIGAGSLEWSHSEKTAKLSLNSHLATSSNISLTLNDEFTSVSILVHLH
jgi:hypothetical protein